MNNSVILRWVKELVITLGLMTVAVIVISFLGAAMERPPQRASLIMIDGLPQGCKVWQLHDSRETMIATCDNTVNISIR